MVGALTPAGAHRFLRFSFLPIFRCLHCRTERVSILDSSMIDLVSCLIIHSSFSNYNFSPLGTSGLDIHMWGLIWWCSGVQGGRRGHMQGRMPAGRLRAQGGAMAVTPFKLFCLPSLVSWYMQSKPTVRCHFIPI